MGSGVPISSVEAARAILSPGERMLVLARSDPRLRASAAVIGRGDDAIGNPHRAQMSQFEFFELILLLKLDQPFPIEQFEATVSQSTVPFPPLRSASSAPCSWTAASRGGRRRTATRASSTSSPPWSAWAAHPGAATRARWRARCWNSSNSNSSIDDNNNSNSETSYSNNEHNNDININNINNDNNNNSNNINIVIHINTWQGAGQAAGAALRALRPVPLLPRRVRGGAAPGEHGLLRRDDGGPVAIIVVIIIVIISIIVIIVIIHIHIQMIVSITLIDKHSNNVQH